MTDTPGNASNSRFSARIHQLNRVDELQSKWLQLESKVDRPFFLSWPWIETWLTNQAHNPWVVQVEYDNDIVGIGLFCESVEVRHKVLKARQLCLNSTGDGEKDAITIEFNSFICDPVNEVDVWRAALSALRQTEILSWDEILIKGATEDLYDQLSNGEYLVHLRARAGSAKVDLDHMRTEGFDSLDGFVATLSKNTRSQIRRSIRLYEERGPIELHRARDANEAWNFLQEGAPHHSKRWEEKGGGKAFERKDYVTFHKALIDNYYESGVLEVIRIRTGEDPIAWIYNFVDRGHVYFYLGALVFEDDNRLKPGLVAHCCCIAQHIQDGSKVYDFMGGENRYKTSLGQPGPTIVSFALQRPTLAVRFEDGLRKIKQALGR